MKMQDEKFHIAIVRPPMVYGDGCKGNYPRLEKLAKYAFVFPDYHNRRSMVHIDILSEYLAKIIREVSNGYFHPQDAVYGDTCEMIVKMRRKIEKKTLRVRMFNFCINYYRKGNGVINKMFGDFYYSNIN
jgi:UDP-glucose 4-epimerase